MTKKQRLYLSGPISDRLNSGASIEDIIYEFSYAKIVAESAGYEVYNPVKIAEKIGWDKSWIEYMKIHIPELAKCDCIWFISKEPDSKGVAIERAIAESFGIKEITL